MLKVGADIDNLVNSITMYRLVLYGLIFLAATTLVLGFFNVISYGALNQARSLLILLISSLFCNIFFSKLFKAPTNLESVYITAFILFFVLIPSQTIGEDMFLAFGALLAMASKYVFATNKRHIFNPAAIAAVILVALGIGTSLWWIGTPIMLAPTLVVALLIVRKIRKFKLFLTFLLVATSTAILGSILRNAPIAQVLNLMYFSGPIIFFAGIMLTEPQTTPPTAKKQLIYAVIVGVIYATPYHVGPFFSSPELALIIGNIYSYFVSSKEKLILTLVSMNTLALDTYEFIFKPDRKLNYVPGQYLEWTLPHKKADSRGVRRYFTIASSPTENAIKLGVKFNPNPSSFKKKLLSLKSGERLTAGQLMGDFLLPTDATKKLVFIAGGIGITPFRSMIEYLIDKKESRSTILFYSNKTADEIAYKDILEKAENSGIKTIYLLTEDKNSPKGVTCENCRLDEEIVKKYVPDYKERIFYLSGPNAMVHAYKELLVKMGVNNIITDYFPGF